uniref:Uncharacterized protein n=1 Tax=Mycena chlorophos TaxID=658473 RepID=A0ABQ0L6A8_MYCCL|nr:predicted protein [Mycena chlorophos]
MAAVDDDERNAGGFLACLAVTFRVDTEPPPSRWLRPTLVPRVPFLTLVYLRWLSALSDVSYPRRNSVLRASGCYVGRGVSEDNREDGRARYRGLSASARPERDGTRQSESSYPLALCRRQAESCSGEVEPNHPASRINCYAAARPFTAGPCRTRAHTFDPLRTAAWQRSGLHLGDETGYACIGLPRLYIVLTLRLPPRFPGPSVHTPHAKKPRSRRRRLVLEATSATRRLGPAGHLVRDHCRRWINPSQTAIPLTCWRASSHGMSACYAVICSDAARGMVVKTQCAIVGYAND